MRRVAWFSPLLPSSSPAALASAALLPRLAESWSIDVFVDRVPAPLLGALPARPSPSAEPPAARAKPGEYAVLPAHSFVSRNLLSPYDVIVYHVADHEAHGYVWAYLAHAPGLLVLHTLEPHRARRLHLMRRGRADLYRAELEATYPAAATTMTVQEVAGLAPPLAFGVWPLRGPLLARARAIAVHDDHAARTVRADAPGTPTVVVPLAIAPPPALPSRREARARLALPPDACVFASLDGLGPSEREDAIVSDFSRRAARWPDAWLLLAGPAAARRGPAPSHPRVRRVEPDAEDAWTIRMAADVGLQIEWPRGTSEVPHAHAAWLAAGIPLVAIDRPPTHAWPLLNPQSWRPHAIEVPGVPVAPPVGIGVPVVDQRHSLMLALERLAADADLRASLGRAAAAWAAAHADPARAAAGYHATLEAAVAAPAPPRTAARAGSDGTALARRILEEMGTEVDFLAIRQGARLSKA